MKLEMIKSILSVFFILVFSATSQAQSDRERFPLCTTKSDEITKHFVAGHVVETPLCFQDIRYLSVLGLMDYKEALSAIAHKNLFPVTQDGQAIVNIAGIEYGDSSFDVQYKEVVIAIMVASEPMDNGFSRLAEYAKQGGPEPTREHGFYVYKIWVE
ncbi:MAG: hypothetical protein AAF203_03965 [Pseudomonadota bacterium]